MDATTTKCCSTCGRVARRTRRAMCANCYRIWQRDNFPTNATCEVCGVAYFRRPSASPMGRTCRRECFVIWKKGHNRRNEPTDGATMLERACAWCGEPFRVERRRVDKGLGRFCSPQCNGMSRRDEPAHAKYPENAWRQREGFRKLSDGVLAAPNVRCAWCGERRTKGNLVIHHPTPPNGERHLLMDTNNMTALCRACHFRVHQHEQAEAS